METYNSSFLFKYIEKAEAAKDRYRRLGNLDDLNEAIATYEEILNHFSFADPEDRLAALNDSAGAYLRRYWVKGQLEDLDRAIMYWENVVEQTPSDSIFYSSYLNNLASGLRYRYARTGNFKDLEKSVEFHQLAVDKSFPGFPGLSLRLNNLGLALCERYLHDGRIEDLQKAIEIHKQAVEKTSPDDVHFTTHLNNLGKVYSQYHEYTGKIEYLQKSIDIKTQVLEKSINNAPGLDGYLANLGTGLLHRYDFMSKVEDLDRAVEIFQQSVKVTPPDSPALPNNLHNMGNSLIARYSRLGALEDIQQAINSFKKVVDKTPKGAPKLPTYMNSLANALRIQYTHYGDFEDLEDAIEYLENSAEETPKNSPELADRLNNLANGLLALYGNTKSFEHLNRSVSLFQQSLNVTPASSPEYPGHLNSLGTAFMALYDHTGITENLQKALGFHQQAINYTSTSATAFPYRLNNLGNAHSTLYSLTGKKEDYQQAVDYLEQAAKVGMDSTVSTALQSAKNWMHLAFKSNEWEMVERAYKYAFQAGQRLMELQLLRDEKESWLKESQGLPAVSAYAFAKRGKLQEAIAALEQGSARLLRESLAIDRANLDLLKTSKYADIYTRYKQAIEKWRYLSQQPVQSEEIRSKLKAAHQELEATINTIKQIKGYEDFLKPPAFSDLQTVTKYTTPVYLVSTKAGGLALIVQESPAPIYLPSPDNISQAGGLTFVKHSTITPVWLPELTETKLHQILAGATGANEISGGYLGVYFDYRENKKDKSWFATLDETTQWLWNAVMEPLIKVLPSDINITLIPIGLLNLLPLHAAWIEDDSMPAKRRYASDTFTISYSPNAYALSQAKAVADQTSPDKLLGVDEPRSEKVDSLPNSEFEVQTAMSAFENNCTRLQHEQATLAAVNEALKQDYTVLHFSCHGSANLTEPLKSELLMANNQPLTLKNLLDLRLKGVRLATLSACETGVPGLKLPDEVVNLPSGLLQAGVAGVISTLWSVDDLSTMMLMTCFYDNWRQKELEPVEALRQAQIWIRDSTNREKLEYFKELEKAKLGDLRITHEALKRIRNDIGFSDPKDRDFAYPYYWAAFQYTGV